MKTSRNWKQKSAIFFVVCGCVLGGCSNKPEEAKLESLQTTSTAETKQGTTGTEGVQGSGQPGATGTEETQGSGQPGATGTEGVQGSGQPGTTGTENLEGQIADQSFTVTLDGWGEVTFAAFEPEFDSKLNEDGELVYGEVRFMLLEDGEIVYRFPGFAEDDIRWYVQDFQRVAAIAFKDYNEDGRMDILAITESVYVGDNPEPSCEARLYTQEDGSKEFVMDMPVMEYLWENKADSMEEVYRALDEYAQNYSLCTSTTAWEVERFAKKVKKQILNGDFEGLAQEISYPVTVDGITYQDSEAFLQAPFVGNVNPQILSELEQESCQRMFADWQGIMLGNGCVWIGEVLDENFASLGLKVIGLNGLAKQYPK